MSARMLAERLGLRRVGREWRGACPACGYAGALILSESREGRTLWWCASCRDSDALTAALRGTGCLPPPVAERAPERPSDAEREAFARTLWERAREDDGTIRRYLDSRGLRGFMPDDLRLLPSLRHRESGTAWPCMLAAVRDAGGTIRALHRSWLRHDGTGKAPVEPARKTMGPVAGCAVRLHPATDALIVAEGAETALAASLLLDVPAWATLSAGGLESVILPARIRSVLVAADNDRNDTGQRAAETLARRLAAEGRSVRIAVPEEPGTDFNDVLCWRGRCTMADAAGFSVREVASDAPDMSVLRLHRRAPPALPLDLLGAFWARWIADAAEGASAPRTTPWPRCWPPHPP